MTKRLLLNALVTVLGDFVDGLTEENLKVGVWSGKIILNHLKLNQEGMKKLKLPIEVRHGFVETLEVSIPWASLESQPVKILVEDVHLLVCPVDFANLNLDEVMQRIQQMKAQKLDEVEKIIEQNFDINEQQQTRGESYFERLTTKIIDNLEIQLRNVHLRYEDSITIPNKTFSFGITLDSFTVSTTNSEWEETFIARSGGGGQTIHKISKLQNLTIYWNVISAKFSDLLIDEWREKMKELIYKSNTIDLPEVAYILEPPNVLLLKIQHNEGSSLPISPSKHSSFNSEDSLVSPVYPAKVKAMIESINLQFRFDKSQYQQLMLSLNELKYRNTILPFLKHRPSVSAKENPRLWWKYALILVTNRDDFWMSKVDIAMLCCRHRRRYMQLALGRRIVDGESGLCDTLSVEEEQDFRDIESVLPMEALTVFRQLSIKEALLRNRISKRNAEKKKALDAANSNSWLWLGVGYNVGTNTGISLDSNPVEEEDLTLDSLTDMFITPKDPSASSQKSFTLDLTLKSSSSVQLTLNSSPLCNLKMSLTLEGSIRPTGISFVFKMTDILMVDQFTPSPLISHLICVKRNHGSKRNNAVDPFVVRFEAFQEKTKVTLTALPLEVCLNKLCIQQIVGFFQVPPSFKPVIALKKFDIPSQEMNETTLERKNKDLSTFEFIFEADAPKIIIPEHSSIEFGFLLLDTGHLSVKGTMSTEGMMWEVTLNAVNAGLPLSASDMYIFSEQSLYLIRPFNVYTIVQTRDRSRADMTVSVDIQPGICGEIDAKKLSRVMHLIQVIAATFRPNSALEGEAPVIDDFSGAELVDPRKCSIFVEANIPEVSLVMQYNSLENHYGILAVPQLSCRVEMRPYDFSVLVDMNEISIEDSLRHGREKYILNTPRGESDIRQVHVSYISINNKISPLYQSHATQVLVEFQQLCLYCDPHSILFIRPFYEVILGKRYESYPLDILPSETRIHDLSEDVRAHPKTIQKSTVPSGLHALVSFEKISCELLQIQTQSNPSINILEGALHHRVARMFALDIYQLTVDVSLDQLVTADVQIASSTIIDLRDLSKDYFFKSILKSTISEDSLNLARKSTLQENFLSPDIELSGGQNQFSIIYKQESSTNSFVDIIVRDMTGYVSLDTILDLIEVSLANTFAALELVRPLEKSLPEGENRDISENRKANISVHVSVPNPQLILLEDPMTETTRAIVGRCGIDVRYSRETVFGRNIEINEALHISMIDSEIFVISNMKKWNPHQILHPMTLEFHLNRMIEANMVVSTRLAFNVDTLVANVSLQDILLAQSIMVRRALIQTPPKSSIESPIPKPKEIQAPSILTAYMINVNIGSILLTLINDFQRKYLPLFKTKLDGLTFTCDGMIEDLRGSGSVILAAESFNNVVSHWEPIIDPWHPKISLFQSSDQLLVDVKSDHTLQFSVTSTFLDMIRQTQSILFRVDDHKEDRDAIPTITFQNHLGVEVDLLNSASQSLIFHFNDQTKVASIFHVHQTTGYVYPQQQKGILCEFMTALPDAVDVRISGDYGKGRASVTRLPLSCAKPKRCFLLSNETHQVPMSSTDPIIEEVFESERYNPLSGEWETPFLVGDPPRWTDSSGITERKRDGVTLPSNGLWEWTSPWTTDRSPEKDFNGDPKGWKYCSSFNSFTSAAHHNCYLTDSVRRRRWYRVRTPVASSIENSVRPLSFFWDCHLLEDGSKVIHLRTFLQIQNILPYPVSLLLINKSWENSPEVGPIAPKEIYSIPLRYSSVTSIKIRPCDTFSKWSQELRCTLSINNHSQQQDVLCFDLNSNYPVPIRTLTKQEEKSLLVLLYSPLRINNSLPCQVKLRFFNSLDERNISGTIICVEEVLIQSGSTCQLRHISLTCEIVVSINIGNYGWSQPRVLRRNSDKDSFDISYAQANGTIALQIQFLFLRSIYHPCEMYLFSEWALVDRTGLDIALTAKGNPKGTRKIQRSTYNTNQNPQNTSKQRLSISPSVDSITHSKGDASRTPVSVYDLVVKSSSPYVVSTVNIDSHVYIDRDFTFSYLPYLFRGQTYIQTACQDSSISLNDSSLIEFHVNKLSIVLVLIDKKLKVPPSWLLVSGFKRIFDQCIATGVFNATNIDIYYTIYGKIYQQWELVSLGSQYNKLGANMFTILIIPGEEDEFNSSLLSQMKSESSINKDEAESCWIHGNKGMTLFSTIDGVISIGIKHGTVWTPNGINLRILGTAKGPLEILDPKSNKSYELAYNVVPMPGIFHRTKVLTIMPRYCIVNCIDEPIEIRQRGSHQTVYVEPFSCDCWHKLDMTLGTIVQLKCLSTKWSFGSVDLNEIGSVEILLPTIEDGSRSRNDLCRPLPTVLNVNIRLADDEDNCAVIIVIWKSKPNGASAISIKNDSDAHLSILQADLSRELGVDLLQDFEISVPPHSWIPFGWADPDAEKVIKFSTTTSIRKSNRVATIDVQNFNEKIRIPYGLPRQGLLKEVVLSVESLGNGRVIRIDEATKYTANQDTLQSESQYESYALFKLFQFQLSLTSIGLSLICDTPRRKEFFSLYIENLFYKISSRGNLTSCELKVEDIQIDNYADTVVYPVLFRKIKDPKRKYLSQQVRNKNPNVLLHSEPDDDSLIQFAFSKELIDSNPFNVKYNYFTLRILEIAIEIDSGTIQQFFSTFLNDIKVLSRDEIVAHTSPHEWIHSYSQQLLSIENRFQYADVYKSQLKAQESKLYFEYFILHPMKLLFTFLQTEYCPLDSSEGLKPKTMSTSILDLFTSAAAVELMEIRLNSFIVSGARESVATLQSRILAKMWQDVKGQLAQIAGSLSILGSPVGLARNIGNGVQDFFYEPYLGLVQSPEDFLIGIKNGTSSLMAGVVSGTLNSTVALIGTASSGISYLSGDSDFIKQRLLSRQKIHASRHGAFDSLKDGGEQVISGITSGVSGIFLKPLEEAHKDGAVGFLRGVGFGVFGAAVKPVLGIADGLSSLAHGISNELGDASGIQIVRPPRTFVRSSHDPSVLLLNTLDLIAAEAQQFIKHQAQERKINDEFIVDLKVKKNSQVILSEKYLYWRIKDTPLIVYSWTELSHCIFLGEQVGLYLYHTEVPVLIPCKSEHRAIKLYALFVQHSYLFGNPSMIIPLDLAIARIPSPSASNDHSEADNETLFRECLGDQTVIPEDISVVGLYDGYKFGSSAMLNKKFPFENLTEIQLVQKVRLLLYKVSGGESSEKNGRIHLDLKKLDEISHWFIYQWDIFHAATTISRCCLTIILNRSSNAIQILRANLKSGREVLMFGSDTFEEDSRSILPHGFAVVFTCGTTPTFLDHGKIQLHLTTGAFEAIISSTIRETTCTQLGGYNVGFLEKTCSEWWSKYVMLVT